MAAMLLAFIRDRRPECQEKYAVAEAGVINQLD